MVIRDFDGERINRGKSYAEYLKEAQQRKTHHSLDRTHTTI